LILSINKYESVGAAAILKSAFGGLIPGNERGTSATGGKELISGSIFLPIHQHLENEIMHTHTARETGLAK